MAEYITPRVDWAFKRIFGSDDTKECLITFLNGVFEDELVIKDVKHLKTEQTRHQKARARSHLRCGVRDK